ncbi:unnamed protein product [Cochlearia groenlandica]
MNHDPTKALTLKVLKNSVNPRYLDIGGGLSDLRHTYSVICGEKYLDAMNFYRKEEFGSMEEFEDLIEKLLVKNESAIVVDYVIPPSYTSFIGTDIYISTAMECERIKYEIFGIHVVLITGGGAQMQNERLVPFWEFLESRGCSYGNNVFSKMARNKGLISMIVEPKVNHVDN